MDPLRSPLVDFLLQVLCTESFDLVVHAAGLETRRGQRRRQRNPFAPPQKVTPTNSRSPLPGGTRMGGPYLPRVLRARLQRDGARQVGGDLEGKGGVRSGAGTPIPEPAFCRGDPRHHPLGCGAGHCIPSRCHPSTSTRARIFLALPALPLPACRGGGQPGRISSFS